MKSLPFLVELNDEISIWRAETFWAKEPETIAWIDYWGNFTSIQDITFVDVGANIGLYSLYAGSNSKFKLIFAIEPMPSTYEVLKTNVLKNNFQHIKLVNSPLYAKQKDMYFSCNDKRVGSSSWTLTKDVESQISDSENIATTITGDSLIRDSQKLAIVKIDVDGDEFNVLQGFQNSIKNGKVISILVEVEPQLATRVHNFLVNFDFVPHRGLNSLKLHSSLRRKKEANPVRNLIFTQKSWLKELKNKNL